MVALRIVLVWIIFMSTACSGEAPAQSRGVAHAAALIQPWSEYAGIREEIEAQTLELRDEMISAHLGYMSALEKALAEVESLSDDQELYALGWTRIEYLLDTAYRLLPETCEYDAFLKATESLIPAPFTPPEVPEESASLENGEIDELDMDEGGGLFFNDAEGSQLVFSMTDSGPALLPRVGADPLKSLEGVRASPKNPRDPPVEAFIPLIRARAAWLRAMALERMGRVVDAGKECADLGLIRDWALLGPLEGMSEDDAYYLNENLGAFYQSLDANRSYVGRGGERKWRAFSSSDPMGRMIPGAMFRGDGAKSAIFLALVYSEDDLPAVIRFGSNAAAQVYVNNFETRLGASIGSCDPDREAANVWISKGWNVVLVRTTSMSNDWAFTVRLTLPEGKPFPGHVFKPDAESLGSMLVTARQAAARTVLEKLYDPLDPVETGGISALATWLQENPNDARAHFYLASLLVAKRLMEGVDRFDRELIFRRAIDLSGRDAFFTLMSARSVDAGIEGPDREENLRLVLLKSVADTGSSAALVDIGRLYLDVMRQPRRADDYADMALTVNPMSLRAGVLDYDVAISMGWEPVAKKLLDDLVKRHPTAAAARLRSGRSSLKTGQYRSALTEYHSILSVDAGNREALDGAVVAMGMLGQTSAAVDLLVNHIELFPQDFPVRLKLVDLYRVLGREDDARAVLHAALQSAPDDPEALAVREDMEREGYAEGRAARPADMTAHRQELDLTPARVPPKNGWEFLYFQVEDRMEKTGVIKRNASFALKIYTMRAANMLRHLSLGVNENHEKSVIKRLDIIESDGKRQSFTPPRQNGMTRSSSLFSSLPPLAAGMAVEAEVEIHRERISFLGDYFGHVAPLSQQAPVRLSRYLFTSPKDRKVFFKPSGGAPEAMVVQSEDGEFTTRIWEMSNLPAFISEPFSPGIFELTPCVQVSAFGNWDDFARWYWRLIGVQYHAPPELRNLAAHMDQGERVPMAKLDRAATWISMNIGYRPWEYGLYAFRPINARSVLSRLSADSKDRTLLICLLAKEYGLDGWPVLARMRNQSFVPVAAEGPSLPLLDHFNYSLALVHSALGGDVFMDASNPYRPPAVMPSQLFGSPGLVVTPNGARRISIPDGGVAACDWREEAELVVDEDGSVLWEEKVSGVGIAAEMLRRRFRDTGADSEAWYEFLVSQGGNPSAISDQFGAEASIPAAADWEGRARLRSFATVDNNRVIMQIPSLPGARSTMGERLAFPLDLTEYARQGERQQDLLLPHGFRISRRISVRYPPEWRLLNPEETQQRKFEFGNLTIHGDQSEGSMEMEFTVEVPGHRIAAGDFPAFREMAAMVVRWIRPELVWEKP